MVLVNAAVEAGADTDKLQDELMGILKGDSDD